MWRLCAFFFSLTHFLSHCFFNVGVGAIENVATMTVIGIIKQYKELNFRK